MSSRSGHYTPEQLAAILEHAAGTPPNGTESNFQNPANNNALAIAVAAIGLALSTFVILVRAYSRLVCTKVSRVEDCKLRPAIGKSTLTYM